MRTAKTLIRWADAQADLISSLGAQPFCWFCHVAAQMNRKIERSKLMVSPFNWLNFTTVVLFTAVLIVV